MNRFSIGLILFAALYSFNPLMAQGVNEEYGKASYYSDALHGRPTASGAPYDKDKLTCAHKTLPYGTKVKVTRLDNQRSVVVEVTDRGPHREGFVVDLSRRAAEDLDMIRVGITRVRVERLDKSGAPAPVNHSTAADPAPESSAELAGNVRLLKQHTPSAGTSAASPQGAAAAKEAQPAGTPPAVNPLKAPGSNSATSARNDAPPPTAVAATAKAPAKAPAGSAAAPAQPAATKAASGKLRELYQVSMRRPAKEGYAVQLTALSNVQTSMDEISRLEATWPGQIMVILETDESLPGQALFKLLVGPFTDRKEADLVRDAIAKKGYKKAFVIALYEL